MYFISYSVPLHSTDIWIEVIEQSLFLHDILGLLSEGKVRVQRSPILIRAPDQGILEVVYRVSIP